jgi:hypothetical protein
MNFKSFLLCEAAFGPQNIKYSPTGFPNIRIVVLENGREIQLWSLKGQGSVGTPHNIAYKYVGDLGSEDFGDTNSLKGYKLYNYHADRLEGYGPLLYDIAMEIATKNGGYLASTTFLNALKNLDPTKRKESKGTGMGGDTSDAAENLYKFYYWKRSDVEKVQPNIILGYEDDQGKKPHLYELYRKQPTTLNQFIQMNNNGKQPVLTNGVGEAIIDLNFNIKK